MELPCVQPVTPHKEEPAGDIFSICEDAPSVGCAHPGHDVFLSGLALDMIAKSLSQCKHLNEFVLTFLEVHKGYPLTLLLQRVVCNMADLSSP